MYKISHLALPLALAFACCQSLHSAAEAAEQEPFKAARKADSKLSKYERQLLNFECNKAISSLSAALNFALKKNDAKLASRIMRMIALAFRLDENDRAASQAALFAAKLNPADELARAQAAEYLFRDGRWQESEAILEQLTQSRNRKTSLRANAFLAHQRGNILYAIEALESYTKENPDDERALLRLSYLYLINEESSKAAETQRKLAAMSKTEYLKEIYLGRADESEHNGDEADKHYRQAGKHLPGDPLWHAQIGVRLMKAQKIKEADAELRKCFAPGRLVSTAYTNWAVMQAFFGSSDNAKSCLEYLTKLRPNASETYFVRGVISEKTCSSDNAEAAFTRATELNPHSSSPYLHLINLPRHKDKIADRTELCRKWSQGCPNSSMAAIELGNALNQEGKTEEALESFHRAEELLKGRKAPSDPNMRISICKMYASIACIEYQRKDLEAALAAAITFNHTRPESAAGLGMRPPKTNLDTLKGPARKAAVHALLADALVESRFLGEAEQEYRQALKDEPANNTYHSCLLKVLLDKKDFAGAAAEDVAVSQHIVTHIGELLPKTK